MKVRATTSLSVDPADASITREDILASINNALASFKTDFVHVGEAEAHPEGNLTDDGLVIDVIVVFHSDSYASVDRAMLDLTDRIEAALENGPHRSHMDSRDTQLVPA